MRSLGARVSIFSAAFLSLALAAAVSHVASAEEAQADGMIVIAALAADEWVKQPGEPGLRLASDLVPAAREKQQSKAKPAPRREFVRQVAQRIEPRPAFRPVVLYLGVAY